MLCKMHTNMDMIQKSKKKKDYLYYLQSKFNGKYEKIYIRKIHRKKKHGLFTKVSIILHLSFPIYISRDKSDQDSL